MGGIFGLLPTLILGKIGDFIPSASDRYTYSVSIPNLYHSLGSGGVQTLREVAGWEQAKQWEQAMYAHRDAIAATIVEKKARLKAKYKEAKAFWYSKGDTPRWGYRAIAKHVTIPIA